MRLSGFWSGNSGVAYFNYWITACCEDRFGTDWVLSTQQQQLYRGNAMDLTASTQLSGSTYWNKLTINHRDVSDFALSELIVFNEILDAQEIECIENYFNDRYLLSFTNNPTLPSMSPTIRPSRSPLPLNQTHEPTLYPSNAPTMNPTSTKWIEIAQENVGNTGTDKFRFLDFGNEIYSNYSIGEIFKYKIEWQSSFQEYIVFELNDQYKDHHIFEDTQASIDQYIGIKILESSNTANFPIENNHYFCKACSSQYGTKYGDSCWAVTSNSDTNRVCGCSSVGWTGIGIYYGGWAVGQCNICGCWGGAFSGYTNSGGAKGGVTSVGLRISIEVYDSTTAPTIDPTITS